MTVKGGSRPACAACRFQRRRCSSDCPLAPYFPANQPKIFQDVHRLYGVGNTLRVLNQLKDDEEKQEAMKSIKYESHVRMMHRRFGCYGFIVHMHKELVERTKELQYVRLLLDAYKNNNNDPTQDNIVLSSGSNPVENETKDQVLGGVSNLAIPMTKEEKDLGFYYNDPNANEVMRQVMAFWDDDVTRNQSLLDEYQYKGESSIDYTQMTSGSFVEDQTYKMSLESDTKCIIQPDAKANENLLQLQQGVHGLTMNDE